MKYKFSDIFNNGMYDTAKVMYVCGPYSIFNNIVIDKLRDKARGEDIGDVDVSAIMSEYTEYDSGNSKMSMDFDEFMSVCTVPSVVGKWFCNVQYSFLTKKQRATLDKYIKNPSDNGILVITSLDWKEYRELLKKKTIINNPNAGIIQLSFPYRNILNSVVNELFIEREVKVALNAIELFVMRMSTQYDKYEEVIDNMCKDAKGTSLNYDDMASKLKGVDNYVMDDFLSELTNPVRSTRISNRRKIYKMYYALKSDMGSTGVVKSIKYKVEDMIEFRKYINNGVIPVMVKYSTEEIKVKIHEDSRIQRLSDKSFKRYAYIASLTTLRDWVYIKILLSNIKNTWNEEECDRAIISVIHRNVLNGDRLANDMGIGNIIEEGLYGVNSVLTWFNSGEIVEPEIGVKEWEKMVNELIGSGEKGGKI